MSSAGEVNGEVVTVSEFNRELSRRVESMKQMMGGKISEEQLKMFKINEGVFNEIVQRKLILQDCAKSGMLPSDAEVRKKIQELPYFQKDGRFDMVAYKGVLANNRLTPSGFEKMIRDDLTLQHWMDSLKGKVQVSDDEIEREFAISNDKRNIKYALLDSEAGRKAVVVPGSEIDAFLKDPARLGRARTRFEGLKSTTYKGKKFEDVQRDLARDVLAGEKSEEVRKASEKLADQVLPVLAAGSDSKANALLKSAGVTIKSTGLITRQSPYIQGIGESKELLADAFGGNLSKPKKYSVAGTVVVAWVTESKSADPSKLASEKAKLEQQLRLRKERVLEDEWIQSLKAKAKIVMNPGVTAQ